MLAAPCKCHRLLFFPCLSSEDGHSLECPRDCCVGKLNHEKFGVWILCNLSGSTPIFLFMLPHFSLCSSISDCAHSLSQCCWISDRSFPSLTMPPFLLKGSLKFWPCFFISDWAPYLSLLAPDRTIPLHFLLCFISVPPHLTMPTNFLLCPQSLFFFFYIIGGGKIVYFCMGRQLQLCSLQQQNVVPC